MSKEIKIIPDWYEKFWDAMEKLYPNAVYIPEICDAYEYLAENVIQPLIDERAIFINRMNKDELKALLLSWYNNDIEFKDVLAAIEEAQLLPNLDKSTENLSKIKDKDEWLQEVRGEGDDKWAGPPLSGTTPTGANTVSEG